MSPFAIVGLAFALGLILGMLFGLALQDRREAPPTLSRDVTPHVFVQKHLVARFRYSSPECHLN